jgi:hypothetical protein
VAQSSRASSKATPAGLCGTRPPRNMELSMADFRSPGKAATMSRLAWPLAAFLERMKIFWPVISRMTGYLSKRGERVPGI